MPTRDRPAFLEAALDAIRDAMRADDQLVVVDSASEDPAVRRIAEHAGAIVARENVPGAARARNVGAASSTAPVLAFTDDDCRPTPDWISEIVVGFGTDEQVGFVTGPVTPDRETGMQVSVTGHEERRRVTADTPIETIGHGANLAVRRDAFEAVGGFDETLGAGVPLGGSEDQDLFWRLLRHGFEGRFEPAASVVHRQWRTRRQVLAVQWGYGKGAGALAVKRSSLEGRPLRPNARDLLWDRGVRSAVASLGRRHLGAAATDVVRAGGAAVGMVRARRLALDGECFVRP